ncbi:MAG TPA: DUF4383 domain-containing protein [Allosphingosinicella sp.]|nr:DUF4383 domain-containing protein [Allosphingosinicella sp.]
MSTRTFALIFGLVFLAVGALGFVPGMTHTPAAGSHNVTMTNGYGDLLGLFPVNVLHNAVHILFGLWGLLASRSAAGAVTYARGVAIIYILLAVLGLISATETTFGYIPIYGNDVYLHAALGIIAAYFGFANKGRTA